MLKGIKEKFPEKSIWSFSGFTLEELLDPEGYAGPEVPDRLRREPGDVSMLTSRPFFSSFLSMLSGKMGNEKVTVQNLKVVQVIPEKNLILIKGAIPGPKGGLITIRQAVKSN